MFSMIAFVLVPAAIFLFAVMFIASRYKRCPSNRVLVVYGRVGTGRTAKCVHGGGTFVMPLIQDYSYLSLEPMALDIDLKGALSKENIRVHVPSTFTIGISTDPAVLTNAAERLLGLSDQVVQQQASEIILGQFRQSLATMTIEQINQHRELLLDCVNKNVDTELRKIGLTVINVNIKDLNDDAGYILAIGKKAAAEAVNKANIEVAEQTKIGAVGVANADRERETTVADQSAQTQIGKTQATATQRVKVASLDAEAVKGENSSKAQVAEYNADLQVRQAEAKKKGEVAGVEAQTAVLRAQKEQEVAKLEKETLANQEVEKKRIQVQAEAEATRIMTIAKAEADGLLLRKQAEAQGIEAVLTAKADGYKKLIEVAKDRAPTLLTIEQLPELVKAQTEAIKGIKIDKFTIWDSGNGNAQDGNSMSQAVRGFVRALPPLQDVAKNAGLELPSFLGSVDDEVAGTPTPVPPNGKGGAPRVNA